MLEALSFGRGASGFVFHRVCQGLEDAEEGERKKDVMGKVLIARSGNEKHEIPTVGHARRRTCSGRLMIGSNSDTNESLFMHVAYSDSWYHVSCIMHVSWTNKAGQISLQPQV
jgi:hypothetical protein